MTKKRALLYNFAQGHKISRTGLGVGVNVHNLTIKLKRLFSTNSEIKILEFYKVLYNTTFQYPNVYN